MRHVDDERLAVVDRVDSVRGHLARRIVLDEHGRSLALPLAKYFPPIGLVVLAMLVHDHVERPVSHLDQRDLDHVGWPRETRCTARAAEPVGGHRQEPAHRRVRE